MFFNSKNSVKKVNCYCILQFCTKSTEGSLQDYFSLSRFHFCNVLNELTKNSRLDMVEMIDMFSLITNKLFILVNCAQFLYELTSIFVFVVHLTSGKAFELSFYFWFKRLSSE